MGELPDQGWVLLGTIAGGLIGGLSQILASWLQGRREEKTARRAERTNNLYQLQDQLLAIHEFVTAKIEEKNDPTKPDLSFWFAGEERLRMNSLVRKMENYSVRVGDVPLAKFISDAVIKLNHAKDEGSRQVRDDQLFAATTTMMRAQMRISQLLHTDTDTDLGLAGKGPIDRLKTQRSKKALKQINDSVDEARQKDLERIKAAHESMIKASSNSKI